MTKRTKRCKTCNNPIVKPNISPISTEPLRTNFPMMSNVTKVTIYRLGKYQPEYPIIEVFLMFRNPNMSQALISFAQLNEEQLIEMEDRDPT